MANTLFQTGPAVNCFWKMDLGSSMHIKAVLVIGQVSDTSAGSSTLANWVLTIGNNSDPILNPTFMSATTKWNMSIDVNAWGQNVSIHRTDGNAPLILGYVVVFDT